MGTRMQERAGELQGLSSADAERRLREDGPNAIPAARHRSLIQILIATLHEPMFLLLLAAAGLYLFLGDLGEGLFLLAGAAAAISLVIFQEARSERALEALRDLSQPHARIIRDGKEWRLPASQLVSGDIVLVGEGDRLPADGRLVAGDVLSVDESMLTGESAPVMKVPMRAREYNFNRSLSERRTDEKGDSVYSGTLIVRGQGIIEVERTGAKSELGRIGKIIGEGLHELTPLQKVTGRMVTILGLLAVLFCGLIGLMYWLLRGDAVEGMLAGITIAISLIPEEFPLVLSVFLALGAWRLASQKVLVRRSAIIETLGSATMLCVDKTGTLTHNRMVVSKVWTDVGEEDLDDASALTDEGCSLLLLARQGSAPFPVDPMDKAIAAACVKCRISPDDGEWEPEKSWPVVPDRLVFIQLWRAADGSYRLAAKGAPEFVFELCSLAAGRVRELEQVVEAYARAGLRVLAVARASGQGEFTEEPAQANFSFAGLLCFLDPVREDVPDAIAESRRAGIEVAMITGDHPSTALAVAMQSGIETAGGFLTGSDIDQTDPGSLSERMRSVRIFARISPEQKLGIVRTFRDMGHVVAMTGDGVNDAPALEAAHIGIAMGRRGTDVAREAADLVLMNDSFVSIVGAVRLGRRIFDNLRRAITYITAIHVPIAGLAILPVATGLPAMLLPMHIVLLEIIIDPTCSLVFEAEPADRRAMARPPRARDESLFGRRHVLFALAQGGVILAGVFALYWTLLNRADVTEDAARGGAFIALITGNLVLALTDSSSSGSGGLLASHRRIFWLIAGAVFMALGIIFLYPPAGAVFRVEVPPQEIVLISLLIGFISGGWSAIRVLLSAGRRPAS